MATKIITKTGSGAPTTSDVDRGELAVDLTNKQLYTNDGSSIIKLGSGSGEGQWSLASNGDDIYYNDGNVGIGVTDPDSKLTLNAPNYTSSITDGMIKWRNPNNSGHSNIQSFFVSGEGTSILFGSNAYVNTGGQYRKWEDGLPTSSVICYRTGEITFQTNDASGNGVTRMLIDADGNVGIGTESPAAYGRLSLIQTEDSGVGGLAIVDSTYAQSLKLWCEADKANIFSGNSGQKDLAINAGGNVGIGGEPGTRTAADYIDQAKAKIKSWTAAIKTKLDEEPKANKKAVTLEVTDDAFEVIPTEDLVSEWMAERAIGGGNAKLQVAGDVYATGALEVVSGHTRLTGSALYDQTGKGGGDVGIRFQSGAVIAASGSGSAAGDTKDLGSATTRWKDGYFSGDVNANRFTSGQFAAPSTTTYFQLNSGSTNVLELRETIFFPYTHDYTTLGRGDKRWKDAYFSGTIYGDVDGAFLRAETIVQDGAPVVDSLQIIRAFMKLRDAVDDPDSSVEELRDKLKVAVVDIIDQFQDLVDSVEPDRER